MDYVAAGHSAARWQRQKFVPWGVGPHLPICAEDDRCAERGRFFPKLIVAGEKSRFLNGGEALLGEKRSTSR
ncbi:MAG: hypothetical protein CM15mP103_05110 [Gammaproteobacteria bacterium]|nr:MAG: hypothetical protein CM15mP103_05110 [Gammaproteobacteria bacterium]